MTSSLVVDIHGTVLTQEDKAVLAHPLVAGIILFSRNYENKTQLKQLVSEIKNLPRTQPLFIAVDQEGGRIQRFSHGFTRLPSAHEIGVAYDDDAQAGLTMAHAVGYCMAAELIACGIDFSFAPVLDVDHGLSQVIGCRSFHRNPVIVEQLAQAYIQGMHDAGMIAVGKHYPGHGAVTADSHYELPVDDRDYATIFQRDMRVFANLIENKQLPTLMTAHIVYNKVCDLPVTFSSKWLKQILREQLGFQGIVFSDDLSMAGALIYRDISERVLHALQAGCDYALLCNNRSAVLHVLEELTYVNQQSPTMLYANLSVLNEKTLKEKQALINRCYEVA